MSHFHFIIYFKSLKLFKSLIKYARNEYSIFCFATLTRMTSSDAKIIDVLKQLEADGKTSISFEFFPPKTEQGVKNLKTKLVDLILPQRPTFVDFTWGAGGSTSDLTLEISKYAHDTGLRVNMHLTCTNSTRELVVNALNSAKEAGIRNIVALRGDPPKGQDKWVANAGGFACALDLVKFIREEHGDYFGVAVAGYPEGHPNAIKVITKDEVETLTASEKGRLVFLNDEYMVCKDEDFAKEIEYLKKKVDAGADFIITQLFFDVDVFLAFVDACRQAGITVPIFPGIMPIVKLTAFNNMVKFCKTRVPEKLREQISKVQEDAQAVEALGKEVILDICRALLAKGFNLHLYTLNSEVAQFGILKELGLLKEA
jgi:methylenetetrahydrofolate reductase (NADPH)